MEEENKSEKANATEYVLWSACQLPQQFCKMRSIVIDPINNVQANQPFVDRNGETLFYPEAVRFAIGEKYIYLIETFQKCAQLSDFPIGLTCRTVINDEVFRSKINDFMLERRLFNFSGTDREFLIYVSTAITLVAGRNTRRKPTRFQTVVNLGNHDPTFDPFGALSKQYILLSEYIK